MRSALIFFFFLSAYVAKSFNIYKAFKKVGVLQHGESSKKYYFYIFLWPIYTNPFKLLAEKIFKRYGEQDRIYLGWDGLMNLINDLTKGRSRYKDYIHHVFSFELNKPPEPHLKKLKHAQINVSQKGEVFLFECQVSELPLEKTRFSIYDLDRCKPLNYQNLIKQLVSVGLKKQELETIIQKINYPTEHLK